MSDEPTLPPAPTLLLADLPEMVRARVVGLTAQVLPDVVRVPPALRRFAAFAPQRRARLGAGVIAIALESDPDFRSLVGTQVEAQPSPESDDFVGVAATAWLIRPDSWIDTVRAAVEQYDEQVGESPQHDQEAARLRSRLAAAEQELREVRTQHRATLEERKAENTALRRSLGESRAQTRAARADLEQLAAVGDEERQRSETQLAGQDVELRRLRARLAELEAQGSGERRAARAEREAVSIRARLLLETLLDATSGLQRELGLPPGDALPSDRAEERWRTDPREVGAPTARGVLGVVELEQYLALPHARLLVDGYNVSKLAWPSSSLEAQRIRLVNALAPVVARTGAETTVVFDAAETSQRPVVPVPRGVKVIFSPEGVIADDVLRDLVLAEPAGRVLLMVSNDAEVAGHAVRHGARSVSSRVLVELVTRPG